MNNISADTPVLQQTVAQEYQSYSDPPTHCP